MALSPEDEPVELGLEQRARFVGVLVRRVVQLQRSVEQGLHSLSSIGTPEALFASLVANAPAQPFVTYYDEATGERSELSAKSLANWVAKTHFLLGDELGLGVGDSAFISLPAHWISVPALLGVLTAGLSIGPAAEASAAFVAPSTVSDARGVPDVYCISPESAAFGLREDVPDGAQDYVLAVRPQPDAWLSVHSPGSASDACWDELSRGEVVELARSRARELGMADGARVLTARQWAGPADWIDTLLAPLAVGGSVVYVQNAADDSVLERRASQERAGLIV
jgi:uncharacterized protein (TIGR03089 family)